MKKQAPRNRSSTDPKNHPAPARHKASDGVLKTNPIGPGTKNLTVNIPDAIHAELLRLAGECVPPLKLGEYCRRVLRKNITNAIIFKSVEETSHVSRRAR